MATVPEEQPVGQVTEQVEPEDVELALQRSLGFTGIRVKDPEAEKKAAEAAPIRRPPTVQCKFYAEGYCSKGSECTFAHSGQTKRPNKANTEVCRFHILGFCLRGEGCMYSHDLKRVPCRFFHLWKQCTAPSAEACRFSHDPIDEATRAKMVEEATTKTKKSS